VFLCSVSAGFIVVLPRKPGKVTSAAVNGRVKAASTFSSEGAPPVSTKAINEDFLKRGGGSAVALQRVSRFHRPLVFML